MSKKDSKVLRFPSAPSKADYQRVKSTYTVHEIKQLFGLSERLIKRWTEQGVVPAVSAPDSAEPAYDFQALTLFRRVRDLRGQGLTLKQVEAEIQGQMNLFKAGASQVARLLSPFEEALLLHERGEARAAETYREAIREGDNVADAYCNLGIIELEQGNITKALDCFTLSLKNEPRHVEAHYDLANLYFDAGDLKLARLHYETALELEPSFSPLHYNLALVYYHLGDLAAAVGALHRYKELAPEDESIDRIDQLLNWLERARELSGDTPAMLTSRRKDQTQ
ncbi:MAG TPA: tetratricopeptide repeat protein [Blastocatellia bacterium]|jgi:tetratricopeptide (TPR) repeat protein|nr:tetratricopeptide repeat protein [Blastocatellia bacterium]